MATSNDSAGSLTGPAGAAQVMLPSAREIVIVRAFAALRQDVFDAWTRPEHVAQWWDPGREPLAACEIDLRPDGAFRFVPRGGAKPPFAGTYRQVEPPSRLVFATDPLPGGPASIGTLTFDEQDGRTTLTITIACATQADRDALLRMRIDAGTSLTLDNLAAYLERRSPAGRTQR